MPLKTKLFGGANPFEMLQPLSKLSYSSSQLQKLVHLVLLHAIQGSSNVGNAFVTPELDSILQLIANPFKVEISLDQQLAHVFIHR